MAPHPRAAFDRKRKQYVAEDLFPTLQDRQIGARSSMPFIGLLTEDMYTLGTPSWRFAFGIRSPDRLAVVSRARMDPRFLGLTPDPALRMRRLEKMVTRNVGVLALGLSLRKNPRSVLYDTILSTDDLDYMTEAFRPSAPSAARRRNDFLAFLRASIALEDMHLGRLAAIAPAAEDSRSVRALLDRFRRSIRADRATLAKLSSDWSTATLSRSIRDGLRASLALKSNALELGSRSCSRYFDPTMYR